MAGRVFTQGRCFTYINIFNPSALHILPYLILSVPLAGTVPILGNCIFFFCSSGADFEDNFYSTGLPLERFINSDGSPLSSNVLSDSSHIMEFWGDLSSITVKLRLGWQSLSFDWNSFPIAFRYQQYRIVCSETYKGPWGSRPREAMALDLQILITLCVLSSEPHSSLLRKGGQGEGTWTLTVQVEAKS